MSFRKAPLGVALCLAAFSCRSGPAPTEEKGDKTINSSPKNAEAPSSGVRRVRVHPDLLKNGRVELALVARAGGASGARAVGEIVPSPDGEALVAALVGGRVAELAKHEGDVVARGDVLAWIESPDVGIARADLLKLDAEVELSEKRLARARRLSEENAISQSALEETEAALAAARAQRAAVRARLSAWGAERGAGSRVALLAPIAGEIVERSATLGGFVEPGRALFRLVSRDRLRARVLFPSTFRQKPSEGETVTIRRPQTNLSCPGQVSTVSRSVDPASRTVTVFLELGSECSELRAHDPIEVALGQTEGAAPSVALASAPKDAVLDLEGAPHVFVAEDPPGSFVVTPVVVETIVGDTAFISEGVAPGTRIAVRGVLLLKGEAQKDLLGGD